MRFKLNSGSHHDKNAKLVNPDGTFSPCPSCGFDVGDIIETEKDLNELNGLNRPPRFEEIK